MILFSVEAILASSTSKFGIEIPRVDDEDLNSSTESTNSGVPLEREDKIIHCFNHLHSFDPLHRFRR